MIGTCRACAARTDRVLTMAASKYGVTMCHACQEDWETSKERGRADRQAQQADSEVARASIYSRALVDFISRVKKERLESAGKAAQP